jgi:hypothetical protein
MPGADIFEQLTKARGYLLYLSALLAAARRRRSNRVRYFEQEVCTQMDVVWELQLDHKAAIRAFRC